MNARWRFDQKKTPKAAWGRKRQRPDRIRSNGYPGSRGLTALLRGILRFILNK